MEPFCAQDKVNNEATPAIADCCRNPLIVRQIFEFITNPELLKLSFVNKLWNYEARSAITKRRDLIARLDRNGLCHDVQAFVARPIKTLQFSGIRIAFPDKDNSCQCVRPLDPIHDVIFDPLPFKTLQVQLGGKRWDDQDCQGFLLAKKIIQDLSLVIEELSVLLCSNPENFLQNFVQECSFPNLKILKAEQTRSCVGLQARDYLKYFKGLVSRLPNLREVHSDSDLWVLIELVKGSTVVPVWSRKVFAPFYEIIEDVINSGVRLQRMELDCTSSPSFDFSRFNRTFLRLVQASCTTTLVELTVGAVLAASLMSYGFSFDNVKKLTIGCKNPDNADWYENRVMSFLMDFNFTLIFPNLRKVYIANRTAIPKRFLQGVNLVSLSAPMEHRAGNIKELHFHGELDDPSAQFFAQMFPNIERLHVENYGEEEVFTFGLICQHFVDLKELYIKANVLKDTANFDCDFCGIFFDEAVQLMQKDEEYLKRVHIVPAMPAVTSLRNLRIFSMEYYLKRRPDPVIYDVTNPMFFLSKITGLIALEKCTNLTVTLKISPGGAQAVSHLKPYMSIVE